MQSDNLEQFTKRLNGAQALFIADLHLNQDNAALTRAFLELLEVASVVKLPALYILGDWFDAWVGDDWIEDESGAWLHPIVNQLKGLHDANTSIYFCHGNRDFSLSRAFLNRFGGHLLPQVSEFSHANTAFRIEHGDHLCTDDIRYQRYRKIIQNPLVLFFLRKLPLAKRKQIANKLRTQSTQENKTKAEYIMDVSEMAVSYALEGNDALIHGHTHRPAAHQMENGKMRYVLGDWRNISSKNNGKSLATKQNVEAVVGVLKEKFELINVGFT